MGNYKQEKENVIDVVSNAIAGYVKKTSASEKIIHYVEIEFEKENGFSIDDCYKIRLELEDKFEDRLVDVDFADEGKLKVMVEFSVFEKEKVFEEEADHVEPEYNILKDEVFVKAVRLSIQNGKASTAYLQRRLHIGYAHAARCYDAMVELGIAVPFDKGGDVIISEFEFNNMLKNNKK